MKFTKKDLDLLTYEINGACIEIHKLLGPGLLESVYHKCMKHELAIRGIAYKSELFVSINYKGLTTVADLRCDFLIEDAIVLEIKAVENINPIYITKLMTYMKLMQKPKGIIVNFNTTNIMKEGQKTFVNEYFRDLSNG